MRNDFDSAARYAAKLRPPGFLAWLVPELARVFAFRQWLDTRTLPFPGEPGRTCDTVALFEGVQRDAALALVTEFQLKPAADMPERLLEYSARLLRELNRDRRGKFALGAALLNLTGEAREDVLDTRAPELPGVGIQLGIRQRNLSRLDAAETLAGMAEGQIDRCLLPWIPLMHGGSESGIIEEWKRQADAVPDERMRREMGDLAPVFAEMAGRRVIWEESLEEWMEVISQVVEKWRQQGREQGALKTKREVLLRALKLRFGPPPADLSKIIKKLDDARELSRWFDASQTAGSLEEFRQTVLHPPETRPGRSRRRK